MLMGGVALGLTRSPRQYYKTLRALRRDWRRINQQSFNRSIKKLVGEKLLEKKSLQNGSFRLVLTPEGKHQAKVLKIMEECINFKKPERWDGKWRIVLFDIPERNRVFRDILRQHLKELDFYKLQHSVFISPYPYEKPILDLIRVYSAESFVRVITASKVDNETLNLTPLSRQ